MLVTLFGIVILFKPLQSPNAPNPILVTLSGIVILVKPLQPINAYASILVTPFGSIILFKPLQPENAFHPILVTFLPPIFPGITSFVLFPVYLVIVIPLSFSSYVRLPYDSACDVIPIPPHSNTHRTSPKPA